MALDAGLHMMPSRLLDEGGRAHFMTKRFERIGNERVHVQSLCAMAHLDFNQRATHDYAQLLRRRGSARPRSRGSNRGVPAHGVQRRRSELRRPHQELRVHARSGQGLGARSGLRRDPRLQPAPASGSPSTSCRSTARSIGMTRARPPRRGRSVRRPRAAAALDQVLTVVAEWERYATAAGIETEDAAHVAADIALMTGPLRG